MKIQRGKVLLSAVIILSMLLSVVLFPPFAKTVNAGVVASGSCGDKVSYELDNTGKLTISGKGPMYDYESYGSNLSPFYGDDDIKSIVIKSDVTSIGEYSFENCVNLTSVTIPSSVTLIGRDAFYNNSSLQSVTIPNGVKAIELYTFYGCSELTSVTIPNSVTSIGYCAFGCCGLTSVTIPSSVTSLHPQAFASGLVSINVDSNNPNYCSENGIVFNKDKTELITFPRGKTDTSYTIPSTVTSIGESAFNSCYNLTSVTIPDGVTTIGTYAFSYCNNLKKVVIPESVNEIGYAAFNECPVTIYCVAGSYARTYAETNGIPFKGANVVKFGTCGNNVSYELDDAGILTISGTGAMKNYTSTSSPFYNDSSIKEVIIESGVTSIGYFSFYKCDNLTSVTIPDGVTTISRSAFGYCTKLESVTIPDSVTGIGEFAFTECTSLSSANISKNMTTIPNRAFYKCESLTSITIPDGVTDIGTSAFESCTNLSFVNIPDSVQTIANDSFKDDSKLTIYGKAGSSAEVFANKHKIPFVGVEGNIVRLGQCGDSVAYVLDDNGKLTISGEGPMYDYESYGSNLSPFYGDDDIKSIVIKSDVTSIGEYSFENCVNLTSVTIPSSVTLIGRDAFYNNSSLQSVTIPNGVKAIELYTFYGCSELTSVTIPNSVTSIGYCAFGCCGLTSVTIPSSVTSLHPQAFASGLVSINVDSNNPNYCSENGIVFNKDKTELITFPRGKTDTSYTIPSTVTSIGESAFNSCYNLTSVTIPDGVTTIGTYAFSYCNNLKKVVIPESVNEIGYAAFNECPVTIYCVAGSYAQTYAETKGISYKCWVTVQYETNGGTAVASQQLWVGEFATKPADPTKTGYTFGGWYKDSACTQAYNFNSAVTEYITLYAKWTADPTKAPTTSPTAAPTKTPTTAPTTVPTSAPSDEGGFEAFVERLYTVALGRASEPEGKAFWCEHVGNGDLNGAQCANEFLLSKEFNDRKLTDEQFLEVLYKTFFDREAKDDKDGFNFWMNCLKTQGRDSVVDCFINSEEWCNVCASFGVKSGATRAKATVASKNATAFATRLYTECLGRDPEEGGLKFWSLGLTNLELSGSKAAREFFFSKEIEDMNLTNEQLITKMYKTFMGRDPDTDGMNYWLGEMKGGMTKEQVFDEFVKSKEFTEICKSYAIER